MVFGAGSDRIVPKALCKAGYRRGYGLMSTFVSSSLRRTLALAVILATTPALAQTAATDPAASPKVGRTISSTGRTMPPPRNAPVETPAKAAANADLLKAQKATEARAKAWDTKMHRTMSSICHGC